MRDRTMRGVVDGRRSRALVALCGALLWAGIAACGDDDDAPPTPTDAGLDASFDAGSDAGLDAAVDADASVEDSGAADAGESDAAPPCLDVDGDGYADAACGGDDCDDTREAVNPGAAEICNAGVDDDCDGLADASDGVCVPCAPGFSGIDGACTDIDECAAGLDDCDDDPAARCENTTGGFLCECPPGSSGSGRGAVGCTLDLPALSGLAVGTGGVLSPVFSGDATLYTASIARGVAVTTLTPTVAEPARITLRVDGVVVASGMPVSVTTGPGFAPRIVRIELTSSLGATRVYTVAVGRRATYVKASNTGADDFFGQSVALSADGTTLAVGANAEDSAAIGFDGVGANDTVIGAGAVYVYRRSAAGWAQEAYVKAANAGPGDEFGFALSLSADGSVLAVGAHFESSAATGVGGNAASDAAPYAGAVYVFRRSAMGWAQEAYVKASNTDAFDEFGQSVALSGDGATLAVGARVESSSATTINGDGSSDASYAAGAVYVFRHAGSAWSQEAYVKAANAGADDQFGQTVALSGDGAVLAVGAWQESSASTGVGGSALSDAAPRAGAVYVFRRAGSAWSPEAYVKASNTDAGDAFGAAVALSADGATLAVGAREEDAASGADPSDDSATTAGAVYVFAFASGAWAQQAYVKPTHPDAADAFGASVSLSADGARLAVGAYDEDGAFAGIGGDATSDATSQSGAAYVFARSAGTWSEEAYVKAGTVRAGDFFGFALALSADGGTLAVGAPYEDSASTGLDGDAADVTAERAGAVYVY